jgi:osmotically inducible lipoprotein OsmB
LLHARCEPRIVNTTERNMKQFTRLAALSAVLAATLGASGCADMTHQQKATAVGAGVGGVAGSVLTNGSTLGTLGGAAAGGVIGHEYGKNH